MGAKKKEEGGAKDASSQDTWGGGFTWQVVNIKQGPTTSETEKKYMENILCKFIYYLLTVAITPVMLKIVKSILKKGPLPRVSSRN